MTFDAINTVDRAADALRERVQPVGEETIPFGSAAGRILAQEIILDRPSPACDVSAMDGFAVRTLEGAGGRFRILGSITPGQPAPPMPDEPDAAVRIFTGAMIPGGAAAVIPRELVDEHNDVIAVRADATIRPGMHIRRQGENGDAGRVICSSGVILGPPQLAAAASCGVANVRVRRRVRVAVLVTGDEVLAADTCPEPWQLRDSNGAALSAMVQSRPWIEHVQTRRLDDQRDALMNAIESMLESHDALILTGGVSVGDHDHVPGVVRELGIEILFHKLPIRPGKPVLGGVTADGKPVLGLPGNPVSVMVTGRLLALPALAARAGTLADACAPRLEIDEDRSAPPGLTWFPLVTVDHAGRGALVDSRGSGDWISAARSDGFVQVPPGERAGGVRRYFSWSS